MTPINDYKDSWWQDYLQHTPLQTCANCKYANEYLLSYWYPYYKPTCLKGNPCYHNKPACEKFKIIGRLSK